MWDPTDQKIQHQYHTWGADITNYTLVSAPGAGKCIVLLGVHFTHRNSLNDVQLDIEEGAGGGPEVLSLLSGDDQVPDHWTGAIRLAANNALAISSKGSVGGDECTCTVNYKIMAA